MGTRVFISWSGDLSKKIAEAVAEWLPLVIQNVEPFYSPVSIESGKAWADEIENGLRGTKIGVICLTRDCLQSPWIHFEAGAVFKGMENTYIHTLLFDLERSEVTFPLALFQNKIYDKEEFRTFIKALNGANEDPDFILDEKRLDKFFDNSWEDFNSKIDIILRDKDNSLAPSPRSVDEMVKEILELVRSNQRGLVTKSNLMEYFLDPGLLKTAFDHLGDMKQNMPENCNQEFLDSFKKLADAMGNASKILYGHAANYILKNSDHFQPPQEVSEGLKILAKEYESRINKKEV
ncbi:MAG: toll/interleukin-1 receptor domain-containing protein [bacterium]|nr:toll/interleukin-1 receptor domain-containing protein [bacterium]